MRLHRSVIGIAVVAAGVIGCSDHNQSLPAGPRVQAAVTSGTLTCDFKSLSQLATHYFPGTEAKAVRGIISVMQDSGAFSTTAKDSGFSVMAHIAANVKAGNTDVSDASDLTNGLLACMFSDPADLPAAFPEDFSVAVNPVLQGGYDVRGGAGDPEFAPVLSRPFDAPFSGVAPSGSNSWPDVLGGNPAPARVLIYGQPGLTPLTFDWRAIPRSTDFSPPVIVGVCLDAQANATSLIHEEHVGLLPFADAAFLPTCTGEGLAAQSWSSQLASRIARWGMAVFGPRPLSATTFLNPGGLAGSTGSLRSEFGPQEVDTVALTFTTQPHDATVNQNLGPVVITVTVAGTTTPVPNVTVTLAAVNNNGTPAALTGADTLTTDGTGILKWDFLSESKTGAYTLVAMGSVGGRGAIAVPAATSLRFNIRP